MRVIWEALIAGPFVIAAVAISQTHSRNGPVFTKDGDLVLPTGQQINMTSSFLPAALAGS
jgi:hypothetical protein